MTSSLTLLRSFPCLILLLVLATHSRAESVAKGTVFHDVNANGRLDPFDKPLPGIRVSNGAEIVIMDNRIKGGIAAYEGEGGGRGLE